MIPYHYGDARPVCGADPKGALLVDEAVHVTCPACLIKIAEALREMHGREGKRDE